MNNYDNETFFEAYAQMPRSKDGLTAAGEWYILKQMFPKLENKKVLDLGCGYGWHCKYAVDNGAKEVVGIDQSYKMIDIAITRNYDKNIKYKVCSILDYKYPKSKYDFVISNLVLHYIEDLNEVYKKVHHTLKKKGIFVFNIEHPVFTSGINQDWVYENEKPIYWPIDNYYYPGERNTIFLNQQIIKQHHTMTQILNGLLENGFEIEEIKEVQPSKEMLEIPEMKNEMRRPMMLLVRARKK